MKKLCILFILLALAGCVKSTTDETANWLLPEGLKDCKIYFLRDGGGVGLYVVRCPNSQTTTSTSGKYSSTAAVL